MSERDIALIPDDAIIADKIVLDMVNKQNLTDLLKKAKSKKCICISGREVFVSQAVEQDLIWFY
jgi:shikimate 5-dehydrogenase